MQASRSHARYKLSAPVSAVRLEDQPGSSLRKPTSTLIKIPPNVIIELEGAVAPSGLVSILWRGVAFSIFYEDLKERAQIVNRI
jgi:hypothetical protein